MSSLKIPILLLKTKCIPSDSYEEYFSSSSSLFAPVFVPVLEHKPNVANLEQVKKLLHEDELKRRYGGMIFTSQRAVEGFAQVVQELERGRNLAEDEEKNILLGNEHSEWGSTQSQLLPSTTPTTSTPIFPLYTVGPATSRTLRTLLSTCPTILSPLYPEVLGSDTGNGEALAKYILEHYRILFQPPKQLNTCKTLQSSSDDAENFNKKSHPPLPPLLFLVGEQRRDIIPKTLASPTLPPTQRIQVDELVVYGTDVMESFPMDLDRELRAYHDQASLSDADPNITAENTPSQPRQPTPVVIVVFSPSGCKELLQRLGLLDESGKVYPTRPDRLPPPPPSSSSIPTKPSPPTIKRTPQVSQHTPNPTKTKTKYVIATIGPTTYSYLETTFNYRADICAETPSPDGVGKGVEAFLRREGWL